MNLRYKLLKRFLDIILAYVLLLVFYIPMIVIALIIKIFDGGPVVFRQVRVGMGGKRFVCYKFRTMRCDAPSNLSTEEFSNAHDYITRIGVFLRRTSLDEIPQLFNVLAGDMSLVGPRPIIPNESDIHEMRKELGVLRVRPGITGLAQICGRDNLSNIRKAECDAIYVSNMCLQCDVKILIATVCRVVSKDGITEYQKTVT